MEAIVFGELQEIFPKDGDAECCKTCIFEYCEYLEEDCQAAREKYDKEHP